MSSGRKAYLLIEKSFIDDPEVTHNDICLYTALVLFADNTNSCPTIKTLAQKARCSERTVYRSLKHLEALGYVTHEQRFDEDGKTQLSNVYTIGE